eukprot:TRINITY_DN74540_c0_g1_i1.p1 TRINITY_DN74540_c0_g1~~TRINITY_DN74540_c0_g1_i1.p1  ORF type:complete len:250 (-),score=40.47 TRINITY_DN74540_c0_g1_i1:69-818(-)
MASTPKLVYLPFRAMAETTRMLFAYGKVAYRDEAIWGPEFGVRRHRGDFPWEKTPVLEIPGYRMVAQSGALARYAAKRAGAYPSDPAVCALSDSAYELAQELCTINPLVNCFVGQQFDAIRRHYFEEVMPTALPQLEMEIERARAGELSETDKCFFGGDSPSHGDFNVFHHLDNAMLLEPDLLQGSPKLAEWFETMRAIPELAAYLQNRPELNGIGSDPGLEDRNGKRVSQRQPPWRAWLVDGCWVFDE